MSSKCIVLFVLSVIATLFSCNDSSKKGSDADSTDTVVIEGNDTARFATEHFTYGDTCDFACVSFDIELPSDRSDAAVNIRTTLYSKLIETCSSYIEDKIEPYKYGNLVDIAQYCGVAVFDKLADAAETQYLIMTAEQRENGEESSYEIVKTPYDTENRIKVTYQDDNVIVFSYFTYIFLGGAHGNSGSTDYTFNIHTGELITNIIDSDKVRDMQSLLKKGIRDYFKEWDPNIKEREIEDQLFIKGLIPLPSLEPSPEKNGLRFTYPRYEIAAYAAGEITFVIPYDKILPFVKDKAKKELGL